MALPYEKYILSTSLNEIKAIFNRKFEYPIYVYIITYKLK